MTGSTREQEDWFLTSPLPRLSFYFILEITSNMITLSFLRITRDMPSFILVDAWMTVLLLVRSTYIKSVHRTIIFSFNCFEPETGHILTRHGMMTQDLMDMIDSDMKRNGLTLMSYANIDQRSCSNLYNKQMISYLK